MCTIEENLKRIKSTLPPGVTLVAVVKGQPMAKIRETLAAGQVDLGENYAQEMVGHVGVVLGTPSSGAQQAAPLRINWHFIGHLQRNKVRQILPWTTLIHTLDSERLALAIDQEAKRLGKVQEALIEVNCGEASKTGVLAKEVLDLVSRLNHLTHLRLLGLMTMPPQTQEAETARPYFRRLREIRDEINLKKVYKSEFRGLSMGMTGDYPVALEEGATLIRIGSGIFGGRQ